MGNAGSNIPRERHKSSSSDMPSSPVKDGQAFVFDKNLDKNNPYQGAAQEEEEPYYTKPVTTSPQVAATATSTTIASEADEIKSDAENDANEPKKKALPTVFKWYVEFNSIQ